MKMSEITPGLVYAIPANEVRGFGGQSSRGGRRYGGVAVGTAAHVNSGRMAAPARVVAIGKFRVRQSGLCASEVVEDHYQTTAKVLVPDVAATFKVPAREIWRVTSKPGSGRDADGRHAGEKRIGFPAGLDVGSRKIKWVETVVPLSRVVMPWHAFLTRHDEFKFIRNESAAYHARIAELRRQASRLATDFVKGGGMSKMFGASDTFPEPQISFRNSRGWSGEFSEDTIHVRVDYTANVPIAEVGDFAAIVDEIKAIEKKLSCTLD